MKKFIILFVILLFGIVSYAQQATSAKQDVQIKNQRTQILQNGTDSARTVALSVTIDSLKYKTNQMMGLNGHYPAITTTATTYIPLGWCVNALEATVIAFLSFTDVSDSLTTITLAAGQSIYGKFKHIKLTSGKVIVYK